ncbi:MAG: SHOCT domain-containing protein [Phycisphaerales bacterium]|nr:SHOCT domain-containing protein [Phycisphaerales bacterium]MDP6891315.1 SHOCT domain-containing protein [Phycisphaerales bacterium]
MIESLVAASETGARTQVFTRVLIPLLVLAAFVVFAWILIAAIRKRLNDSGPSASTSYTLEELRNMRANGLLSEEEYQRARDQLTAESH